MTKNRTPHVMESGMHYADCPCEICEIKQKASEKCNKKLWQLKERYEKAQDRVYQEMWQTMKDANQRV